MGGDTNTIPLMKHIEKLEALLKEATSYETRHHIHETGAFDCDKRMMGGSYKCTCGAEEWNAKVKALLEVEV